MEFEFLQIFLDYSYFAFPLKWNELVAEPLGDLLGSILIKIFL